MNRRIFTPILLVGFILVTSQSFADDNRSNMQMDKRSHYQMMAKEHHEDMDNVLGMLTETMAIIRGLNHKPSSAEKKKLNEMISKIKDIQKRNNERRKQMDNMNMDMMDMDKMDMKMMR